jgi:hypothetical protein
MDISQSVSRSRSRSRSRTTASATSGTTSHAISRRSQQGRERTGGGRWRLRLCDRRHGRCRGRCGLEHRVGLGARRHRGGCRELTEDRLHVRIGLRGPSRRSRRRRLERTLDDPAIEDRLDPLDEGPRVERLRDVPVRAAIARLVGVERLERSGEEQHRHGLGRRLHGATDLVPRRPGHDDVGEDDIRQGRGDPLERFPPRSDRDDTDVRVLERELDDLADRDRIVGEEQRARHEGRPG